MIFPESLPDKAVQTTVKINSQFKVNYDIWVDVLESFLEQNVYSVGKPVTNTTIQFSTPQTRNAPPYNIIDSFIKYDPRASLNYDQRKSGQPFYKYKLTIPCDMGRPNILARPVNTTIILNGKNVGKVSRGKLYELLKGGTYFVISDVYMDAFVGRERKVYVRLNATQMNLVRIESANLATPEEIEEFAAETSKTLDDLGIKVPVITDEEAEKQLEEETNRGVDDPMNQIVVMGNPTDVVNNYQDDYGFVDTALNGAR